MFKLLRFTAVAAVLVISIGIGCKKNSPPEVPGVPQGPNIARPGAALKYALTTTDPDGDSVSYMVSWGDSTPTQWSPGSPSGDQYIEAHTYVDSGKYFIKAKAKDSKNAESAWSDSVQIAVGYYPPNAPSRPQGKAACTTGVAYTYTTKALDPLGDSVRIRFFWGAGAGDTSAWGALVGSNLDYSAAHTFTARGTYKVAARAEDAFGLMSPWSDSLTVTVDTPTRPDTGHQAHNIVLTAATDTTVNITWTAPTDSVPSRYVISFREVGASTFDSVGGTASTVLSFVHDPAYKTGRYQVTAVFANGSFPSVEPSTTIPVDNIQRAVPELNESGNAGYGWDRTNGSADLHDMTNADTAALVDLYVTDFKPGFAGPFYYTASPLLAPSDPGGGVPPSIYWHNTGFAYLDSGATDNDPLPPHFTYRYRDSTSLDSFPITIAFYTYDSFFGLVKASDIDTSAGIANIETWFQRIKNLRLIEH